jgi:hypothetical protein
MLRDADSGYEWAHLASLLSLPPPGLIMPQNTLETVNELIAGSFGGAAQVLVGQPLDTIKTRAQIAPSSVSFLFFTNSPSYHARTATTEGMFVSAILALFYARFPDMPQRKGPWIS